MKPEQVKRRVLELKERFDRELDELLAQLEDDQPANDSEWRRVTALAHEVGLSPKTIHRCIAEAKPHEKGAEHPFAVGEGRRVRVHRAKFERWRSKK